MSTGVAGERLLSPPGHAVPPPARGACSPGQALRRAPQTRALSAHARRPLAHLLSGLTCPPSSRVVPSGPCAVSRAPCRGWESTEVLTGGHLPLLPSGRPGALPKGVPALLSRRAAPRGGSVTPFRRPGPLPCAVRGARPRGLVTQAPLPSPHLQSLSPSSPCHRARDPPSDRADDGQQTETNCTKISELNIF